MLNPDQFGKFSPGPREMPGYGGTFPVHQSPRTGLTKPDRVRATLGMYKTKKFQPGAGATIGRDN